MGKSLFNYRCNICTTLESGHVSSKKIHQNCFRNVIGIMTCHNLINLQEHCTSVQSLTPKHPAKRTVIFTSYLNKFIKLLIDITPTINVHKVYFFALICKLRNNDHFEYSPLEQFRPLSNRINLYTSKSSGESRTGFHFFSLFLNCHRGSLISSSKKKDKAEPS